MGCGLGSTAGQHCWAEERVRTTAIMPLSVLLDKVPPPSFLLVLSWRLVNAFTVNTFFQADEYWQALEPAHAAVFGYGYLTWEWEYGLRSYIHPLIYMLPYSIVKSLHFTSDSIEYQYVIASPKIINALIAAIGDYYLYHLILIKFQNVRFAKLVSLMSLLSAWNWYCWCRSFSNSLELSLTILALYNLYSSKFIHCLVTAAFTCLLRPTNAIIWIFYFSKLFIQRPILIPLSVIIALIVISLDSLINYQFYSSWKIPLWNFFKFNVSDSLSSFYGISRLDFYFFQAIPILLLNYLPFFIYGIFTSSWSDFKSLLLLYLLLFTLIPHKEFRFIYPMMPILLTYSASGLMSISKKLSTKIMKIILTFTILLSILLSYYFTRYHEIGELQITTVIRDRIINDNDQVDYPISVGFLTPCHSTPFQSHFHLPIDKANIWFLTCEPPLPSNVLPGMTVQSYMDESDYFYENPLSFLKLNFPQSIDQNASPSFDAQWPHKWPTYIVMFSNLWDNPDSHIKNYLQNNYDIVERIWNAPGHWDDRREGDVLLLKYNKQFHLPSS